ncbi:MAG: 50S ribosomal protein L9 [Candidatus Omnitrophota bacterium]
MEVILRQDVDRIGKAGTVIKVKEGFARNYLLPKGLAYPATPRNLKVLEEEFKKKQSLALKVKQDAAALAAKLSGLSCTVSVDVNENEKMYGSVGTADIIKALAVEGYSLEKEAVILEKPIEELGIYEIEIKLHPEAKAKIRLWVTKR